MVVIILFYLMLGILFYIYFGYPIFVFTLSKLYKISIKKDETFAPTISLIISAYNEDKIIREKLENTLKLDYPKDKIEIIVVSDGSTDKTNEIVNDYKSKGVKLLALEKNMGKTIAQNEAVKVAHGEIIVFSDANAIYEYDAIKKLVRNFKDPKVGCVCGELRYIDAKSNAGKGEGLYWKYEKFLKLAESNLGNVLGANGSIYSVRKVLYEPLPEDIISDFVEPLIITSKGYRTVYEPEAVSYEEPLSSFAAEFRRKIRIVNRSYRGLLYVKHLLNPMKYGFLSIGLISHKLLRWLTGFFLVTLFLSNLLLISNSSFYKVLLLLQVVFYILALIGYKCKKRWKLLIIPTYFCMVNLAAVIGIVKYYCGNKVISWQPIRE